MILLTSGARAPASPWDSENPIREELFSVERLEQHAESLAAAQPVTARPLRRRPLAARLKDNEAVLLDAYRDIAAAVGAGQAITPAAEWLLDNYHLVEEQIRQISDDLPAGFYRQLPKLAVGPFAGYPRVFGVAWAFVAHTDSRFDPEMLRRFVNAYQRVQPLMIGELWAVAISLRIVLVENLRRAARRVVDSRVARQAADVAADRLLGVNGRAAEPVASVLGPYERGPLPVAFAVQLIQRLRDQDPEVMPALPWLDRRLDLQGTSADEIVRDDQLRQGATNVTARNIITSMRLVSDVDWADLFESVSPIDAMLREAGDFAAMDFSTRNMYRSAIEQLARGSKFSELEIARAALRVADEPGQPECVRDPGYHLIARGRRAFERQLGYRAPLREMLARLIGRIGIGGYATAVVVSAALLLGAPLAALAQRGLADGLLLAFALLGAIPALDLAVALVNRVVTTRFAPARLPALELRSGVGAELRTMLVAPTLLTTPSAIEEQIAHLEIHYLSSPEGEVHFALLSDWMDAATEHCEGDAALLEVAAQGIARLNQRYGAGPAGERFLLLHRRRMWNAGQQRWMGWERKRGKLHELNRLLRGAADTSFVAVDGLAPSPPAGVRYVITLDCDTRLPPETVRRLIGKMAHPLNRPRLDPASQRVVEGYAILQPRVTPALPIGNEGSVYQRIFSSMNGIDPYAAAVSDVYQDLFGEGSYTGKGIYDVDAFSAALDGRVPDNSLLSHDLFEGSFARAGLASDVEVVEEFPSRYDLAAARQHRWARGDWQLLPWMLGRVDVPADPRKRALAWLGLWKMSDNLRRSLSAPAAVLALLAGWLLALPAAAIWTAFVLVTIALPALLPVLDGLLPRRARITGRSHLRALTADLATALSQIALQLAFVAHQAALMADAIARTLYRLLVSRRRLLDWTASEQANGAAQPGLDGCYRMMSGAVVVGGGAALVVAWAGSGAWPLAMPLVIAWLASPAIACWASRSPPVARRLALTPADTRALRRVARRTWRYFETFVTTEQHMLPPDNFQETPKPVVAHRTSPTNIGLYLLAAVSARDFGWAGTTDTAERLAATLATMAGMQRLRGHFYNWYDTQDLRPLTPRYVSSVDSGNLAGHLLALANACRDWQDRPLPAARLREGIDDAAGLVREALAGLPDDRRTHANSLRELNAVLDDLDVALGVPPAPAAELDSWLDELSRQAATITDIAQALVSERDDASGVDLLFWTQALQQCIDSHLRDATAGAGDAADLNARLQSLASAARAMALAMDFGFLLDPHRKLLAIGYVAAENKLDGNCYDLLASEARLASFVAIAKGDVPARHWFRLGRAVTPIERGAALISWSGSMFEYLMPSLVMRAPAGTLLEQTSRLVVRRQMSYAALRGLPWGISESAYNVRDLEFTYQYSNFGVPGLGLKRGLSENAVIAPYATALATMVEPAAAARNFERLAAAGGRGQHGFYEALDYSPERVPDGATCAVVRAYMAHHQGMSIVAIANALLDAPMRSRFHAEPIVQAVELLLQERTPRDVAVAHPRAEEVSTAASSILATRPAVRRLRTPHTATPAVHLLSNGRYAVMLTAAGSGYSRWRDFAVTRWREDSSRDDCGAYIYLRDVRSGESWSAGYQPSGVEPLRYDVRFSEDKAEITRRDPHVTTVLQVVVSPEDDAEVRRVSITNRGTRVRDIEVTSYAELALAPPAADAAHLAFSKMFVQTEHLARAGAILATRRRRDPAEAEIWAAHLAVVEGEALGEPEIETDRARFVGRGRDARAPVAIRDGRPLSNSAGTVLDPVFALRRRLRIAPGGKAHVAFWTMVAPTRDAVLDLVDKHHDVNAFERAATLAWIQAQVQLRHLGVDAEEAALFQRLAGRVLYADPALRPPPEAIARGAGGPAALWTQGISGDLPIVLVRIDQVDDLTLVVQLLRAHEYWRIKQLAVDLVILNERASSYVQDLQIALETAVRTSQSRVRLGGDGAKGAVFVLRTDLVTVETRARLFATARVVLAARSGSLADQVDRFETVAAVVPPAARSAAAVEPAAVALPAPQLEFFNGLGGFAQDGREYVTILGAGQVTPAPWINVIANRAFGFEVSVEGSACTWAVNSRENQLTPWSNDPVTDRPGEALYLRDEDSGALWTPTALPIRDDAPYVARHGFGYSRFEHTAHGIESTLLHYVPLQDSLKISRLTLRNASARPRRLSVTAYVEWVLGSSRSSAAPFIVTQLDPQTGALLARNPWNATYAPRVAFFDMAGRQAQWTGDRREFLGRNGRLENPAALATGSARLSRRVGAGVDPCGVLQAPVTLKAGESVEIVIFLGQADGDAEMQALIERYRKVDLDAVLAEVTQHWRDLLGAVQVKTPDRAMDLMLNGWLLYQTLACRVWARSGFYQASGAYGFRDQLQDVMALLHAQPALAREHLLRAAARQFVEGDVQHWWLPPLGNGVRTRISDDRVWLAHAAAHYVQVTGDSGVLQEPVPFLQGPPLQPGDHDAFYLPQVADSSATLYEHCARALEASLALGVHGLPLIGTGDWNDGMNRVGEQGRGESVWLGWFLHATLTAFAPIAEAQGETARAVLWLAHARALQRALEQEGWDGAWYRRGYYDDGTPLGSAASQECRIDSIAQSWSVISGAADPERAAQAMAAVQQHLVRTDERLALLFTPPFDQTPLDPGYIKGYPRGIRENGGQYTHAAAWSVIALAMLGDGDAAQRLFALLNPVNHSRTRAGARRYKVEPYVVAADVYSEPPHQGRGGWTWYTGSAGWMYRAGIESILGLRREGGFLLIDPCIPRRWPQLQIDFRNRAAHYSIAIENPTGVCRGVVSAKLDGENLPLPVRVPLAESGSYRIDIVLG